MGSIFGAICGGHIADILAHRWPRLDILLRKWHLRHGRILFGQVTDFLKIWVLLVTFVPCLRFDFTSAQVISEPPRPTDSNVFLNRLVP